MNRVSLASNGWKRRQESRAHEEWIDKANSVQDDSRTEREGRQVDVSRAERVDGYLSRRRREGGTGGEERRDSLCVEDVCVRLQDAIEGGKDDGGPSLRNEAVRRESLQVERNVERTVGYRTSSPLYSNACEAL